MGYTKGIGAVPCIGFAFFLAINATQVWGGVFPFLPLGFQTPEVTLGFYLAQMVSFVVAIIASTVGSYYYPVGARHMFVGAAAALVAAGSVCIIAAMYVEGVTFALVFMGGMFLGVGTAAFFMLWQRYFAAISPEDGTQQMLVGTALSAVAYFVLHLVPDALTAFLVPTVMLPISALCLDLCVREISFDQPMFEDVPREHPEVYGRFVRDSLRTAVCLAALGFSCGLARGVALVDPTVGDVVNIASMAGSLVAAVVIFGLSRFVSMRFNMLMMFRSLYPIIITGLLLFPFFQTAGLNLFAGVTYMAFSAMVLVMMMQSAQISRDRGTNPVFVYGVFALAIYAPQGAGFMLGYNAQGIAVMGVSQVALLSMVAAYVMGMALLLMTRSKGAADAAAGNVEIINAHPPAPAAPKSPRRQAILPSGEDVVIRDRLSKQCLAAKDAYGLSTREAEVMELIVRGNTVAAIAKQLFVSENTVRTHSKHIYTKMDVHSKQELAAVVEQMALPERV